MMGSDGQGECQQENWEQYETVYEPDSTLMCAGNSKEVMSLLHLQELRAEALGTPARLNPWHHQLLLCDFG